MNKVGSRFEVIQGYAKMTAGGLRKKDLVINNGKITSMKMLAAAKKRKRSGSQNISRKFLKVQRGGSRLRELFGDLYVRPILASLFKGDFGDFSDIRVRVINLLLKYIYPRNSNGVAINNLGNPINNFTDGDNTLRDGDFYVIEMKRNSKNKPKKG